MIAVDTNILIYAHRSDSPWHSIADRCVTTLAESGSPWMIPWPCIYEFMSIVTNLRIYQPPTSLEDAISQVECWLECPTLLVVGESTDYFLVFKDVLQHGKVSGPLVHDARVFSICLQHGVKILWSADRDFTRFEGLNIENPLLGRA